MENKATHILTKIAVNIGRLLMATTFIFSGFVKGMDPLGTQYKITDYLEALHIDWIFPSWSTLGMSVLLGMIEFAIGIFLLFAIHRRQVSRITLFIMSVMTLITLWIVIADPVKDCGCFGDAIILSNTETFIKNIILLVIALLLWRKPFEMKRLISKPTQWIVINYTFIFSICVSLWSLWTLPQFDFRPYHIGANIAKGMEIPKGAKQPKFDTTFILEKNGERKEFTIDNYPDSTWTFIDSKTVQTEEGYVPPIHDFSIEDTQTGLDITQEVIHRKGGNWKRISIWLVFRYKYLEKLLADKFSILEDIKSVKIGNEMTLTLSIGIGTGADNYAGNYDLAKAAMDLALGRGGDQAVVKKGDKILYYGGKSQQMEKNTRVKVRVKAHALRQILDTTDNVLVMGHKLADIDSFGSAIGIYTICRKLGKNVHIVINDVTSSVKPFMKRFIGKDEYPEDLFLLKEEAPEYVDAATVVIVVDVNKPQLTECPELLDKCKTIVVFDHHRQSSDQITGAVLSYVDPYASSASEMITEMIQYVDDNIKIKAFEADALYAGINIDTDGFNSKSGPRTFEAAAFLRRHGADVTRVRKMLRNDMDEYKAVAHAVSRAEVYRDAFAIAIFNGEGLESPTIGGAKAANQLLDISGIKASFVITEYNEKIYISARSIDEVNVQLVMEKLGGGGHMSIAGAQLTGCTVKEAVDTIKETLDNMLAEGEI